MNVTIHRRCRGVDRVEQRIREIGEQAGSLVAQRVGGSLPLVEIVLTDRRGVTSLTRQASLELAGEVAWGRRALGRIFDHADTRHSLASTTLTRQGVAVFVNILSHLDDLRMLDRTIVHELVHAVQLAPSTARERHVAYLRQQYGTTKHSKADEREYLRLMGVREEQAERLESLARQLPKGH